ncbi:hypothetical protein FQV18_0005025, partial [Eudyptula minor novaehollandiae]
QEAQKVYVRREEETQKKQARILVAAVKEGQKGLSPCWNMEPRKMGPYKPKNQSQEREREVMMCFYCGKKGHIKRDCRKRKTDERMFNE